MVWLLRSIQKRLYPELYSDMQRRAINLSEEIKAFEKFRERLVEENFQAGIANERQRKMRMLKEVLVSKQAEGSFAIPSQYIES